MPIVMALATAAAAQQPPTRAQQHAAKTSQTSSRAASGDRAFAMKAAPANLAEVELGTLALQKTYRTRSSSYGWSTTTANRSMS